ncbi:hypothetical protein GCK32_019583, partial [Trichostrongylus colubriformis]
MAGPIELKSQKSLLTRYGNKLEHILSENEDLINLDGQSLQNSGESQRVQSLVLQLNSTSRLILDTLKGFTSMVDSLGDAIDKEQMEQVQEYIDKTHNVLERAQEVAIRLESDRVSARDYARTSLEQSAANVVGLPTSPDAQMGNLRKVWAARMDSGSEEINWTMKDIISDLDKIITTEERMNEMMGKNTNFGTRIRDHDRRALSPSNVQKGPHWTSNPHLVKFLAEVTLHDHSVILKWQSDGQLQMIETICRGMDFCSNIECNFCLPILLNPECWPLGAIIMAALILYGIVALVYILLYVPMTIGKPIRLVLSGIWIILKYAMRLALRSLLQIVRRRKRPSTMSRRARIAAALAIVLLMTTSAKAINGCQHVNILEQQLTTCTEAQRKESCTVTLTELLKINTLHRQACLRLRRNNTFIGNLK